MKRLFRLPIKYKKTVITVFALLSVVCIFLSGGVGTNYNMAIIFLRTLPLQRL